MRWNVRADETADNEHQEDRRPGDMPCAATESDQKQNGTGGQRAVETTAPEPELGPVVGT